MSVFLRQFHDESHNYFSNCVCCANDERKLIRLQWACKYNVLCSSLWRIATQKRNKCLEFRGLSFFFLSAKCVVGERNRELFQNIRYVLDNLKMTSHCFLRWHSWFLLRTTQWQTRKKKPSMPLSSTSDYFERITCTIHFDWANLNGRNRLANSGVQIRYYALRHHSN